MKGICALGLESDCLRSLFACVQNNRFVPFSEASFPSFSGDIRDVFSSRIDLIDKEIRFREKKHSFVLENIFCNLPADCAKVMIVEDVWPLTPGKKRKLTAKDIADAKAHVENVFLDWNQSCLHNIVLEYYVDDVLCPSLNPVPEGRKLKIKSQLVYIDRKFHAECSSLFENIGRKFSGFVYGPLSDISLNLPLRGKTSCPLTLNLTRDRTLCSGIAGGRVKNIFFDFGEKELEEILSQKFLFSPLVCREIFQRHVTFGAAGAHKEVVIKDGSSYVNVSVSSLNSFLQEKVASALEDIFRELAPVFGEGKEISFLGRMTLAKGFFAFLNTRFPDLAVASTEFRSLSASLLGCIKYGTCRYLESVPLTRTDWFSRIMRIYKEYF